LGLRLSQPWHDGWIHHAWMHGARGASRGSDVRWRHAFNVLCELDELGGIGVINGSGKGLANGVEQVQRHDRCFIHRLVAGRPFSEAHFFVAHDSPHQPRGLSWRLPQDLELRAAKFELANILHEGV
jgi:hypothetical protein